MLTRPWTAYAVMTDAELSDRRARALERATMWAPAWIQQSSRDVVARIDAELSHPLRGRAILVRVDA